MAPASIEGRQTQMATDPMIHVVANGIDFTNYVQAALSEIKAVRPSAIHRESALRWAARAVASFRICAESEAHADRLCYRYLGEQYREAALAHAAMGEPWEPLYTAIDEIMEPDRSKAFEDTLTTYAKTGRPPAKRRSKTSR